jgi:hypothetical protein
MAPAVVVRVRACVREVGGELLLHQLNYLVQQSSNSVFHYRLSRLGLLHHASRGDSALLEFPYTFLFSLGLLLASFSRSQHSGLLQREHWSCCFLLLGFFWNGYQALLLSDFRQCATLRGALLLGAAFTSEFAGHRLEVCCDQRKRAGHVNSPKRASPEIPLSLPPP